jgi:hypothetical protein
MAAGRPFVPPTIRFNQPDHFSNLHRPIRTSRISPTFNTFNVVALHPAHVQVQQNRGPDNFFNPAAVRLPGALKNNTERTSRCAATPHAEFAAARFDTLNPQFGKLSNSSTTGCRIQFGLKVIF